MSEPSPPVGARLRIDVVTIFPDYLAPLGLSLPGKAQESGLVELAVHDLRTWATDRHRTVDDTPYGGGAGMVMRPEPWGEALDHCLPSDGAAVLVVPTPTGERFTQRVAAELAAERHLVFACGRYEGIDQRVLDDAADRVRVREVSLGDVVLNGGEVAVLAIVEAVIRLLPGFMGNPDSLAEESHGPEGLLEAPAYTKPPVWRGREVPDVLRSGDHARIAAWRRAQALARTAARRPDLLAPEHAVPPGDLAALELRVAVPADAGELLTLRRAGGLAADVAPADVRAEIGAQVAPDRTLVVRTAGRLVASVRVRQQGSTWHLEDVVVAPDLQGRGIGAWLLGEVLRSAPPGVGQVELALPERPGVPVGRAVRRLGLRPVADPALPTGYVRWRARLPRRG